MRRCIGDGELCRDIQIDSRRKETGALGKQAVNEERHTTTT
jgi:hypothetical protein